jgi:Protein of unknown function (DUF2934)
VIPEDAIRQRSYEIWKREGCPEGRALEHWLCAMRELEAEFEASVSGSGLWRNFVMPRLPMTRPPQRVMSMRITKGTPSNAARR